MLETMGPWPISLLLIAVLSTCAQVQPDVLINTVDLTILPQDHVNSGTDVLLECKASIVILASQSSEPLYLRQHYIFYKNDKEVNTIESEAYQQSLSIPQARVADSGVYYCKVKVNNKNLSSTEEKLTVEGLQTPTLVLNTNLVLEGNEVFANCSAPLEHGSFFFYFYENSKEVKKLESATNTAVVGLQLKAGLQKQLNCAYVVDLRPGMARSNSSNIVILDVQELSITPTISVLPANNVVEGDSFEIKCTIRAQHKDLSVYLIKMVKNKLMATGNHTAEFRATADTEHTGVYICKAVMGNMRKQVETNINVTELFSKPVLSMHPPEVFENETFTLTCNSSDITAQRIQFSDLKFSIYVDDRVISDSAEYMATASLALNGHYFCNAEARAISKNSSKFVLEVKELVSQPLITASGPVILDKDFQILCHSKKGHHPVHYVLMVNHNPVQNITVIEPSHPARFTVSIIQVSDIRNFTCQAENNGPLSRVLSHNLDTTVIVPVSKPELVISPDIVEGNNGTFICKIHSGSPPVTFTWYRKSSAQPMSTSIVQERLSHRALKSPAWVYQDFEPLFANIQKEMKMEDADTYYCQARNEAGTKLSSDVYVKVELAHWKKGLIVVMCLLAIVIVICVIVWVKNRRGRRQMASELSVKPSSPKSDESGAVSLTHDTEVYRAHKVHSSTKEKSMWCERTSPPDSDLSDENEDEEPDVEYTEVVHLQQSDPLRVPLKKGTDTVYSELQDSTQGAEGHGLDCDSLEYAQLNHGNTEPV